MWRLVSVGIRLDGEAHAAPSAFSPSLRCNRPYTSLSLPLTPSLATLNPDCIGVPC